MADLRTTINGLATRLANELAAGIFQALRGASFDDVMAASGRVGGRGRASAVVEGGGGAGRSTGGRARGRGGRLNRRSPEAIAEMVDRIEQLLSRHPEGLRAEQIREQLGVEAKELPRPLAEGVSGRRLSKQGQKRATTYFAGRGASNGTGRSAGKSAKRAGGRGKKRGAKKASAAGKRGRSASKKNGAAGASAGAESAASGAG